MNEIGWEWYESTCTGPCFEGSVRFKSIPSIKVYNITAKHIIAMNKNLAMCIVCIIPSVSMLNVY